MTDLPVLTAEQQRILGCLLEKERTVPASYPLTLNALRTACNQTSSREPVVDYDERLIEETARELKQQGLVRIVWADTGRRTLKYHQVLAELLGLEEDERSLLTVLLLRGAQAPGELRTRTERLHAFPDRRDVEECLARMAARETPLVVELPRRSGDRDARWRHLLGEPPEETQQATAPSSGVDFDVQGRDERVRAAYDAVAPVLPDALVDELSSQPFERWLLGQVADLARPAPVIEVGCGPGHVTAHLAALGVKATGLDSSPGMIAEARRRFPEGTYQQGDLRSLLRPADADGWGAVLAWYSLVHFAPSELPEVIAGLVRPLRPGGWLVFGGHAGSGAHRVTEWLGQKVEFDIVAHEPGAVAALFEAAGLLEVSWYRRSPLAGLGETSERCYVLGRSARQNG